MTSPEAADTIAAISTPLGEAGIGIVRLSGPEAEAIARRLFRPQRPRPSWQSHRLYLGHIVGPQEEIIDEVLLSLMRAPHTYTREDVVEINCHSGYGVLRRILDLALAQGARLARPGEFTLRAFLAGRLDLTQAEAVLEIIQARSATHLQVAAEHLQGGLGRRLRQVRHDLLDLLARVEAALDFPEEAGELSPAAIRDGLAIQSDSLAALADTYEAGRLLREGLLVVIAGRPNVGKSSLLNRLLDMERAIVTEIPGTTRDLVEESITLGGVVVRFSDTAGLGPARDRVEELGIERARKRLRQADLVLYLVDASLPLGPEDKESLEALAGRP
ncbi:MAG TPA: tRNA uridine-5-carboxymethylaminomethyl(34) synthesis GTPase MnmE, partial [Desulfobaccales bacterium]|nr:tRNA uridine-5-carboxymethylaminomethyl(34) synthesis GTPase MnmE [Desulfobaccales bacterium]